MLPRRFRSRTDHGPRSWPLLLLLVVVIVPTVWVLWFMLAAIDDQRIAVRQRLMTAYRTQLVGVKSQLAAWLQQEAAKLDSRVAGAPCAAVFAEVVRANEADSLICAGAADGEEYPDQPQAVDVPGGDQAGAWDEASRLERRGSFEEAAQAYARIAGLTSSDPLAGRALQARARCLSKDGRRDEAIEVLGEQLAQPRYRSATDPQGRLIAPSAQLLALQLVDDPGSEIFRSGAEALRERLADYGDPVVPAPQRRFLMRELQAIWPDAPEFDTLAAEDLAAEFLDSETTEAVPFALTKAGLGGVRQLASPSGRVVALHRQPALRERLMQTIAGAKLPAEMTPELLLPGLDPEPSSLFVSFGADEPLSGWRLVLRLDDTALVDRAVGRQIAVYVWTGALVIVFTIAAAGLIARAVRRQMRLTQLKNDLLATVSHELKTPLASMRLLVETLLDGQSHDARRVREYLELISKENNRLSRLVDNFLSFSRMERNKQQFEHEEIAAADIVRAATSAVGDRFNLPGCRLEVEIEPDLPPIYGDSDALVTALLNLLDNAHKYSGDDKRIVLRAYAADGHVCFAVRDNGVGLSIRARSKIFERFYQVDQNLSRSGSGCGLGLSIVRFIVRAHGGSVEVESQPGRGSTFIVRLPVQDDGQGADAREDRREAVVG